MVNIFLLITVSLLTKPMDAEHVERFLKEAVTPLNEAARRHGVE